MTAQPPLTLTDLRRLSDPYDMVDKARAYLGQVAEAEAAALAIRDEGLRQLAEKYGPAETVRRTGYSLSTIKAARKSGARSA